MGEVVQSWDPRHRFAVRVSGWVEGLGLNGFAECIRQLKDAEHSFA